MLVRNVSLHRFDEAGRFYVYVIDLADRLPEIAIPLLPGDGEVPLELQAVFDRAYDSGPYRRRVQYEPRQLVPPLSAKRLTWVRQRLKKARK